MLRSKKGDWFVDPYSVGDRGHCNKGFEIDQALTNNTGHFEYKPVGFVPGQGTSTQQNDYSFEVRDLAPGTHYFRLKQLDFDGKETYSPVRMRPVFLAKTRPNPFQNELEVQIFQEKAAVLDMSIVNQWGQKTTLLSPGEVASGETQWRFSLGDLAEGVYYLVIQGDGGDRLERIMVLKK